MSFIAKSSVKLLQNITLKQFQQILPTSSTSAISGCNSLLRRPICTGLCSPYSTGRVGHTHNAPLLPTKYSLYNPMSTGTLLQRITALPAVSVIPQLCNVNSIHTSTILGGNSLYRMNRIGPREKPKRKKNPLGSGVPMLKGVVLKTVIKKPRKPNSANRKCVLVRLSNGKELVAFVPGEGHSLQEHNVVMVKPGRLRDTPGVKIRCIRGCYDLGHVVKRSH